VTTESVRGSATRISPEEMVKVAWTVPVLKRCRPL
jgi:hypothetical protein